MATDCYTQLGFGFQPKLVVDFAGGTLTTNAGLLLIREFDEQLVLSADVVGQISDRIVDVPLVVTPGRPGRGQNVISTSKVPHIAVRRACSRPAAGIVDSFSDGTGGPASVLAAAIALTATSAAIRQTRGWFIGRKLLYMSSSDC
jgi:hypothetical protein